MTETVAASFIPQIILEHEAITSEAPRVCRRPFRLSHAAMAGCSGMA
jgi:hypothetical protein